MDYVELAKKMVFDALVNKLESGEILEDQSPEIAQFTLDNTEKLSNHDHLIGFLHKLALKWPAFNNLAAYEEGKIKVKLEKVVANDMIKLIAQGKTAEALSLAATLSNK